MQILITGATGFIGSHIIDKLMYENRITKIYGLGKRKKEQIPYYIMKYLKTSKFEYIQADITDLNDLKNELRIVDLADIIIHCAGGGYVSTKSITGTERMFKLNIEGTQNLLDACGKLNPTRIIHFGSVSSYGVRFDEIISEKSSKKPKTPHEIAKFKSEEMVKNFCNKHGKIYTILQPAQVYGSRDTSSEVLKMCKLVKKGIFPIFGNGNNFIVPFVYVEDIADFVIGTIFDNNSNNEEFILAWNKNTWNRMVFSISGLLNRNFGGSHVPLFLVEPTIKIQERLLLLTGREPIMTYDRINNLTKNRLYDSSKAIERMNFVPKFRFQDGLEKTIRWYLENGYL